MVKKISNLFLKIILVTFLILFVFITMNGILDYDKVVYKYNPFYLMIGIGLYILVILFLYKKVIPKLVKYKWIVYVLFGIFTLLCLFCAYYFMLHPTWDMGTVLNIARDYAVNGYTEDAYLYQFPNNIMLTIIYFVLLKITSLFGMTQYVAVASFFNALIVALSIILLYYNTKKILDEKKALLLLIICVFTSPLYLYAACYYSDTMGMFLTMLMLFVYLQLKDKEHFKSTIVWQILLGITVIVGIKVKITSLFILIALFVYHVLIGNWKGRKVVRNFGLSCLIAIILLFFFSKIVQPIFIPDKKISDEKQIPTEHWIMMGMVNRGYFSYEEYAFTTSFPTYQEKQQAIRGKIKDRLLYEYNASTFLKHLKGKLGFAWYDGSYFIPDILRREPVRKGILHEFVLEEGEKVAFYKYWPQVMHMGMLIFICINAFRMIKQKDYHSKDVFLLISTYGILVFLLIWENWSRYLVTLLPIIMMLQLNGIDYLATYKQGKLEEGKEEK